MIITVSGFPGTETKRISKELALGLGLRYFSESDLKNKIASEKKISVKEVREELFPEKVKQLISSEAKGNSLVLDHLLAPWILTEANLKVFLQASRRNRALRLSEKEKVSLKEATEEIDAMEKEKAKAFLEGFEVNVYDLEGYDLVLNLDKLGQESAIVVIKKYLEKMRS